MQRILTGAALVLVGCALIIMCLPTWRSHWLGSDEGTHFTYSYTYHRWFATPIGFFYVVAPITMLVAVILAVATVVNLLARTISWTAIALGAAATAFLVAFGYSEQWVGQPADAGKWVAPLLGFATLLLLTGKILTRPAERNGQTINS